MRNLKKILAISLVFAMVFSLSFSALAVSTKDFADAGDLNPLYKGSVDLLLALGAIKGRTDGTGGTTLAPGEKYLRSEMAYLTATIMLGGDIAAADLYKSRALRDANGIPTFPDVSDSDWYAGALYYLVQQGIVTGNEAGNFNPNGEAGRLEVAAFMLGIIGYKKDLQGYTGAAWALNVQRDAAFCGLYANISSTESTITREQVFQMLDNTLNNDSIDYNPVTGQAFYPTDSNGNPKSVLETRYKQFTRISGTFVANQYAAIDDGNILKGRIRILSYDNYGNPYTSEIDNVDMAKAPVEYLGREVYAYAKVAGGTGRFDGILATVVPVDERIPIALSSNSDKFKTNAKNTTDDTEIRWNIFDDLDDQLDDFEDLDNLGNDWSVSNGALSRDDLEGAGSETNWVKFFRDGYITEGYALKKNSLNYYSYVVLNRWTLAQVTAADGKTVTAHPFCDLDDDDNLVIDGADVGSFENSADLKEGDVIMVLKNGDGDPITAQVVESRKATLSSRKGNSITISGNTLDVIGSVLDGTDGEWGGTLANSIADAGNYGEQRDYFVWNNTNADAELIVGFRGVSSDTVYCIVLEADAATLAYGKMVKVLKDDGTVGVYTVNKLKERNGNDYTFGDLYEALSATGNDGMVLFEYGLSADESKIDLKVAKDQGNGVVDARGAPSSFGALTEYSNGKSFIDDDGSSLRLTGGSLIFVNSNDDSFYCFKGYTAPSCESTNLSDSVYAMTDSGYSIRFAYMEYEVSGSSDKFGLIYSNAVYSTVNGKLEMSFDMYTMDGTKKNYVVAGNKGEDGGDIDTKIAFKGTLVEYTLNSDGQISWFKRIVPTALSGGATQTALGTGKSEWIEVNICEYVGGNFAHYNSSTTATGTSFYTNGDTVLADRSDDGNPKLLTRTSDLLTKKVAPGVAKYLPAWILLDKNNDTLVNAIIVTKGTQDRIIP